MLGIGQGIATILLTEFGMSEMEPGDKGEAASGLVNTALVLGGSIGLALSPVVFAGSSAGLAAAHAYGTVFTAATWFYVIALP
ncbi:hypothetical protein NEK97_11825 [Paenarthrobacter sp. UW852]|uniref:hypothetical protein n=1 Tax=Paenarthrobacter sp. UW852 TaxID=2951989 RepID=UPI0021481F35|nr:hypothetical protein [Paenarthrobacter sp. UW852]MCR1162152.1 hypothetical protein [Paenarthrobacter sp. UW852]